MIAQEVHVREIVEQSTLVVLCSKYAGTYASDNDGCEINRTKSYSEIACRVQGNFTQNIRSF